MFMAFAMADIKTILYFFIKYEHKSAFEFLILFFRSVKRWPISYVFWNKVSYLWSPLYYSSGSKFKFSYCRNTETENLWVCKFP